MKRVRFLACFVAIGLAAFVRAAPPPELPVETFFKKPNISQVTFSPDGKRIACLVPYERRMNLAVIDLEKKTKNLLTNFKDNDVGSLLWANNERIIFTKDTDGQERATVYAVNRDGTERVLLVGGRARRALNRLPINASAVCWRGCPTTRKISWCWATSRVRRVPMFV